MINIFIQCRIKSGRLPGKALHTFFGQTIIERVIDAAKKVKFNRKIYLVTGCKKNNILLRNIANKKKIKIFFGDESNVLKRFKNAIKKFKINNHEYILRITADNYLVQPSILNNIISKVLNKRNRKIYDYASILPLSHYSGELFSVRSFLKKIFKEKNTINSKEHVTYNYRKNRKIITLNFPYNFMNLNHKIKITLDTIDDLIFLKKIEKSFKKLRNINCINTIKKIHQKYFLN